MKNQNKKPVESFWNMKQKPNRRLILFEPIKVKQVSNSHSVPRMIKPTTNPFYLKPAKVKVPIKKVIDKSAFVKTKTNQVTFVKPSQTFVKRIPDKIRVVNDNTNIPKKEMNWVQAKSKFKNLNPFGDSDKDGLMNYLDCKPFNSKWKDANPDPEGFYNEDPYTNAEERKIQKRLAKLDQENKRRYKEQQQVFNQLAGIKFEDLNEEALPEVKKKSKLEKGRVQIKTKQGTESRAESEGYGPLYPQGQKFRREGRYKITNPADLKEAKRVIEEKILPKDAPSKVPKREPSVGTMIPTKKGLTRREKKKLENIRFFQKGGEIPVAVTSEQKNIDKQIKENYPKYLSERNKKRFFSDNKKAELTYDELIKLGIVDTQSDKTKPEPIKAVQTSYKDFDTQLSKITKEGNKYNVTTRSGVARFDSLEKAKEYKSKADRKQKRYMKNISRGPPSTTIDTKSSKSVSDKINEQFRTKQDTVPKFSQESGEFKQQQTSTVDRGQLARTFGEEATEFAGREVTPEVREDYENLAVVELLAKTNIKPSEAREIVRRASRGIEKKERMVKGKLKKLTTNEDLKNVLDNLIITQKEKLGPRPFKEISKDASLEDKESYDAYLKSEISRLTDLRKESNSARTVAASSYRNDTSRLLNDQIQQLKEMKKQTEKSVQDIKNIQYPIFTSEERKTVQGLLEKPRMFTYEEMAGPVEVPKEKVRLKDISPFLEPESYLLEKSQQISKAVDVPGRIESGIEKFKEAKEKRWYTKELMREEKEKRIPELEVIKTEREPVKKFKRMEKKSYELIPTEDEQTRKQKAEEKYKKEWGLAFEDQWENLLDRRAPKYQFYETKETKLVEKPESFMEKATRKIKDIIYPAEREYDRGIEKEVKEKISKEEKETKAAERETAREERRLAAEERREKEIQMKEEKDAKITERKLRMEEAKEERKAAVEAKQAEIEERKAALEERKAEKEAIIEEVKTEKESKTNGDGAQKLINEA